MTSHRRRGTTRTWVAPAVLILTAPPVLFGQGSKRFDVFQDNWNRAQAAHETEDFAIAAGYYEKAFEYARFEPSSRFLLADCRARLGQTDRALAELAKAVEYGWNDVDAIAQLQIDVPSLAGGARLIPIVAAAKVCRAETIAFYKGSSVKPSEPAPLVVVLHGLGDAPRGNLAYWKEVADNLGLVVVAPYGVTKLGNGMSYAWHRKGSRKSADLDVRASKRAIDRAIETVSKEYDVDTDKIVLAGFSQGGALALRLLGDDPGRYVGAAAMCTVYESQGDRYWERAARRADFNVYLIVGKLDKWFEACKQAYDEMRAAGINVEYVQRDDMGHEIPVDYAQLQTKALRFVLGVTQVPK